MNQPPRDRSRTWKVIAWLSAFIFGCLLSHDLYYGKENSWLPSLGGYRLFGPVLACYALARFFVALVRGSPGTPESAQRMLITSRVVRIIGILLIAAPWLMSFYVSLTRAPGVRPGNEGEGLGIFIMFVLFTPPGVALTVFSNSIGDKGKQPGTQDQKKTGTEADSLALNNLHRSNLFPAAS